MTKRRRPWHVFVRDIGPTYTFGTEEAANRRAVDLVTTGDVHNAGAVYGEVLVYSVGREWENPPRRRVHRYEKSPVDEMLVDGRWVSA